MPGADPGMGALGHVLSKDVSAKSVLSVCIVNVTSFKTLKKFLGTTAGHVVLAQELHFLHKSAAAASKWLKANGWKSLIADAIQGFRPPYSSVGVAILVRNNPRIGLSRVPGQPQVIASGWIVAGLVSAIGNLNLVVYSSYFYVSEGLSQCNRSFSRLWPNTLKGMVCHGFWEPTSTCLPRGHTKLEVGTCFQAVVPTTLDFFVMSSGLECAVKGIRVQLEARTSPHKPVLLSFPRRLVWRQDA